MHVRLLLCWRVLVSGKYTLFIAPQPGYFPRSQQCETSSRIKGSTQQQRGYSKRAEFKPVMHYRAHLGFHREWFSLFWQLFLPPQAAQNLGEVKDLQPVLQFNLLLISVSGTTHNPEMLRIPKRYYKETKYFENKYPCLRNKAVICSRIMILKYQAVVNSADFPSPAFVQTVLPVNSQTAFGS